MNQPQNIAIIGAGIAGASLAAILGRSSLDCTITVFERDPRDRDQGTGFDVSNSGQKVLKQAGVYDKYMTFSRSGSAIMRFYNLASDSPAYVFCMPKIGRLFFPESPESNREKMRDALISSAEENVQIHFETKVESIRKVEDNQVELLGEGDSNLGRFDLVIDGSGVASSLRPYRIDEPMDSSRWEISYTGLTMIHGIVPDPEASCHPKMVEKLGQGTMMAVAPRSRLFGLQRYGADEQDRRSSLYYTTPVGSVGEMADKFQVPKNTQFHSDKQTLDQIKSWMKEDMEKSNFPKEYISTVDAMELVAIRPLHQHPSEPKFWQNSLPLILIGDALHAVPPYTGSGGNLALEDAKDLAEFLIKANGSVSIDKLRAVEEKCLKRAIPIMKRGNGTRDNLLKLRNQTTPVSDRQMAPKLFLYIMLKLFTFIFFIECLCGLRKNNGRSD